MPGFPEPMTDLAIDPRQTGFVRLHLPDLFGNTNPVVVEIGSGKGRFLIETAMERPDLSLLGIEKSLHYHRLIRDRAVKRGLTNVRLINHDAFVVMQKMLAPESIAEVHVYFPDPWPKRKHERHRLISPRFAETAVLALAVGGDIYLRTEDAAYFRQMNAVFQAHRRFGLVETPAALAAVVTDFEREFQARGIATLRAAYRRIA